MERIVLRVFGAILLTLAIGVGCAQFAQAQDVEDYYARMLEEEVEVVNPVKRPVVSVGAGMINFFGEIRYPGNFFSNGTFGARVNVSTLLGKSKQIKMNVFVMYGRVEGHDMERSYAMNNRKIRELNGERFHPNTAFQTDFYEIGFSTEYNFWQFLGTRKTVRPYVSIGAGLLIYTPKGNYFNSDKKFYRFWKDGTVRLEGESSWTGAVEPEPVRMDRFFETDLKRTNLFKLSSFPPVSAVIPVEAGVDFYLTDRLNIRLFTSLHYTLTDLMDGYNQEVAKIYDQKADALHDMFTYTGFAFHMDLFSQAESFIVDKVFADIEDFDYEVFFADQDGDGVFDHLDNCPDTPSEVPVDSVGCPLDADRDGIPDFRDDEPNTALGAPVDDKGRTLDDAGMTLPELPVPPVDRSKIKMIPVSTQWSRKYQFSSKEIPAKFADVDIDGDGYISFDEVIRAVDEYFTGQSHYSPEEIYELNAFFFAQ